MVVYLDIINLLPIKTVKSRFNSMRSVSSHQSALYGSIWGISASESAHMLTYPVFLFMAPQLFQHNLTTYTDF